MAQGNRGGLWEDMAASYRRTVGELHAVAYPNYPSIRDFGRAPSAPEISAPAAAQESVLEDRLQTAEASKDDRAQEDPEMDR
jgi:hypothetical protein